MSVLKRCSKCKVDKSLGEFVRDNSRSDGRYPQCKACTSEGYRNYRERDILESRRKDQVRMQRYRAAHPERVLELARQHAKRQRDECRPAYIASELGLPSNKLPAELYALKVEQLETKRLARAMKSLAKGNSDETV